MKAVGDAKILWNGYEYVIGLLREYNILCNRNIEDRSIFWEEDKKVLNMIIKELEINKIGEIEK